MEKILKELKKFASERAGEPVAYISLDVFTTKDGDKVILKVQVPRKPNHHETFTFAAEKPKSKSKKE